MKVIYQQPPGKIDLGLRVIISMIRGTLSDYVCKTCFCLTVDVEAHTRVMHP